MISEETVIWNPLFIMNPSMSPPRPMMISRSACAQKSMHQPMRDVARVDVQPLEAALGQALRRRS